MKFRSKRSRVFILLLSLAIICCFSAGCSTGKKSTAKSGNTRVVVDSSGKKVTLPKEVKRVVPAIGAYAEVTEMLTQGSGKIVAAPTKQIDQEFKSVFTDYKKSNPKNRDSGSVEDIIAAKAQVVYGPSMMYTDEQKAQLKKAGIKFVAVDKMSNSSDIMSSIRLIGKILGPSEAKRADQFCEYYQKSINDCKRRVSGIKKKNRVRVLSLNNQGGTYTTVNGKDILNSIIEEAGGVNITKNLEMKDSKSSAPETINVDTEQILKWNPHVILTMDRNSAAVIRKDKALRNVDAVKNNRIYVHPKGLYLWGVRSAENAMMTPWLGKILYPQQFKDVNMNTIVKHFYKKWYGRTINDTQVQKILRGM